MARMITKKSRAKSNSTGTAGIEAIVLNTADEILISIISCGIIIGKPRIAMMAAFCCALAAIAAKKVNTKLRLTPPNKTKPMKGRNFKTGLPKKSEKIKKLRALITSISTALKNNLANTKLCGLVME